MPQPNTQLPLATALADRLTPERERSYEETAVSAWDRMSDVQRRVAYAASPSTIRYRLRRACRLLTDAEIEAVARWMLDARHAVAARGLD